LNGHLTDDVTMQSHDFQGYDPDIFGAQYLENG